MKHTTLYEVLKPIEENLRIAYKQRGKVSSELFRDLEICEEYQKMNEPKMLRYSILADKFRISETLVRETVKKISKNLCNNKKIIIFAVLIQNKKIC